MEILEEVIATLHSTAIGYGPDDVYDKVKCYYSYENNKHIVTIKSVDEKTIHAIAEFL